MQKKRPRGGGGVIHRRRRRRRRKREKEKQARRVAEHVKGDLKGKRRRWPLKKTTKEHGEPVAASIRQLGAQLQPGAVTSTELHGKPSQFASNNGVIPRVLFIRDLTTFCIFHTHENTITHSCFSTFFFLSIFFFFFSFVFVFFLLLNLLLLNSTYTHISIDRRVAFDRVTRRHSAETRSSVTLQVIDSTPDRLTVQRHSSLPLYGKTRFPLHTLCKRSYRYRSRLKSKRSRLQRIAKSFEIIHVT